MNYFKNLDLKHPESFNYVFYTDKNGIKHMWSYFSLKFVRMDWNKIDCGIHSIDGNQIPKRPSDYFYEQKIECNGEGMQIGSCDYTFDIYYHTETSSDNVYLKETLKGCFEYISKNPDFFKGKFVQIVCRESLRAVFQKYFN